MEVSEGDVEAVTEEDEVVLEEEAEEEVLVAVVEEEALEEAAEEEEVGVLEVEVAEISNHKDLLRRLLVSIHLVNDLENSCE